VREALTREHIRDFFEEAARGVREYGRPYEATQLQRMADSVADVPDELLSAYLELMVDEEVGDRLVKLQLALCAGGHLSQAQSATSVLAAVVGQGQRLKVGFSEETAVIPEPASGETQG
jgi:hypothetical protein